MKFLQKALWVFLGLVFVTQAAFAVSAGTPNFFKKSGVNINPLTATYEFGSATNPWAAGYFTTLILGGAVTGDLHVNDDAEVSFGNTYAAPDVRLGWNTAQTVDALFLGLSTAQNTFVIGELGDIAFDFAHGAATSPTLFVHSAAQSTTQWVSLTHNQTNGVIATGAGGIVVTPTTDTYFSNGTGVVIGNATQSSGEVTSELQVLGTTTTDSSILIGKWGADAVGGYLNFAKSRAGAIGGATTIVADNDILGEIIWNADDGANLGSLVARFYAEVDDATPAAIQDIGTAFVWAALPGGGGGSREVMRISAAGNLLLTRSINVTNAYTSYTANFGRVFHAATSGAITGTAGVSAGEVYIVPSFTLTNPGGAGTFSYYGLNVDLSSLAVTASVGSSTVYAGRFVGNTDADITIARALYASGGVDYVLAATQQLNVDATVDRTSNTTPAILSNVEFGADQTLGLSVAGISRGDFTGVVSISGQMTSGGMLTAQDGSSAIEGQVTGLAADVAVTTVNAFNAISNGDGGGLASLVGLNVGAGFDNAFVLQSGQINWLDYQLILLETNSAAAASGLAITTAAGVTAGQGGDILITLGAGAGGSRAGQFQLGPAGVALTDDGDGAITFLGLGNGSDEDLTMNLDDTANTIALSSGTGVTDVRWDTGTGVGQFTLDGSTGGCIMLRDTDDAGWTEVDALDGVLTASIDADGSCD